jgi:4a-hydroxytetrahydrobiopterin dehydratase
MIDPPAGWSVDGVAWVKTFDRGNFDGSLAFINAIGAEANRQDHHPDLALSWNEVTVRTWSHDTNSITERDLRLADAIDTLAAG